MSKSSLLDESLEMAAQTSETPAPAAVVLRPTIDLPPAVRMLKTSYWPATETKQAQYSGWSPRGYHIGVAVSQPRELSDGRIVCMTPAGLTIVDPLGMEQMINQIPGVVSVGLFARRPADVVIVGGDPVRVR